MLLCLEIGLSRYTRVYSRPIGMQVGEFSAHTLADLAWAFATAGQPAPQLFAAIAEQLRLRASDLGGPFLGDALWALAVVEVRALALCTLTRLKPVRTFKVCVTCVRASALGGPFLGDALWTMGCGRGVSPPDGRILQTSQPPWRADLDGRSCSSLWHSCSSSPCVPAT